MPRPYSSQLELGLTLGHLTAHGEDLERRVHRLEERQEKHKAELDKLTRWAERAALLVVLWLVAIGGNAGASAIGAVVAGIVRGLLRQG